MAKLTEKQELFAVAYVASGGKKSESARTAGYAVEYAHKEAHRLLRLKHVQQRIKEIQHERFSEEAPMAFEAMVELSRQSKSALVRYNAAKDIMDRAGYRPPEKVMDLTPASDLDETDTVQRIETLIHDLFGVSVDITPKAVTIEGEVTDVTAVDGEQTSGHEVH